MEELNARELNSLPGIRPGELILKKEVELLNF